MFLGRANTYLVYVGSVFTSVGPYEKAEPVV